MTSVSYVNMHFPAGVYLIVVFVHDKIVEIQRQK